MRATGALSYIPAPPRPLTLASSLRVGPRGGGGLLRKSFATFKKYHTTIPYKSHNPQALVGHEGYRVTGTYVRKGGPRSGP